jgi:hypothetical protein
MLGLPEIGDRVYVWPAPGRRSVQDGHLSLDSGGRWMRPEGREVVWTPFHLEQMRAGDLCLHDPCPAPAVPAPLKDARVAKDKG